MFSENESLLVIELNAIGLHLQTSKLHSLHVLSKVLKRLYNKFIATLTILERNVAVMPSPY